MKATALISTLNMEREDWLNWRKKGIGGSDVGAICGISKYKSVIDVYLDKIGQSEEKEQSEAAYWGNALEEVVAQEFTKRTGKKVRRRNTMFQCSEYPFMLANIDREIIGEKAFLECKTVSIYGADDWEGDSIPDSYMLQIQHYMAVLGEDYTHCYIAVLIGGQRFVWKEIKRDQELINYIIDIEKDFWYKVENKILPHVDGTEASEKALNYLYPQAKESEVVLNLNNDIEYAILELDKIKADIKKLEEEKTLRENRIKEYLGECEVAKNDHYIVKWSNVKGRETFDTKRFKIEHPELANNYLKVGEPSRKLNIKSLENK